MSCPGMVIKFILIFTKTYKDLFSKCRYFKYLEIIIMCDMRLKSKIFSILISRYLNAIYFKIDAFSIDFHEDLHSQVSTCSSVCKFLAVVHSYIGLLFQYDNFNYSLIVYLGTWKIFHRMIYDYPVESRS